MCVCVFFFLIFINVIQSNLSTTATLGRGKWPLGRDISRGDSSLDMTPIFSWDSTSLSLKVIPLNLACKYNQNNINDIEIKPTTRSMDSVS